MVFARQFPVCLLFQLGVCRIGHPESVIVFEVHEPSSDIKQGETALGSVCLNRQYCWLIYVIKGTVLRLVNGALQVQDHSLLKQISVSELRVDMYIHEIVPEEGVRLPKPKWKKKSPQIIDKFS